MKSKKSIGDPDSDSGVDPLDSIMVGELQAIIRLLVDSEEVFMDAANRIEHAEIAALFRSFVGERAAMANELQDLVCDYGNEAPTSGTILGKLHRMWMDLRSAVNGQDPFTIFAEAERGEVYIKTEYEKALRPH